MTPFVTARADALTTVGNFATATLTALFQLPETLLRTAYVWQTRIDERRHLAELDDHLLADLGLDRDTRNAETSKPFWRA